jgi:4-hydroxy-3-methylbut-2-enyl diphosphate reductase
MLGEIVHNERVVGQLKKAGIKMSKELTPGKNRTLLIRAHGISLDIIEKAQRFKYRIVDATCPMVKEIHKIAQEMEQRGFKIIVIGDKEHDEVTGIVGQLKGEAIVIDGSQPLPWHKIKRVRKAAIVVQSTQNLEIVNRIVGLLKLHIKELRFFNTICRPTRMKQAEIKRMPLENDVMIIIGSKGSANTRRLYEISKSLNKRSYWIQSKNDIKSVWFKGVENVGVTAGASTPDETTSEIIGQIKSYVAANKNRQPPIL